MVRSEHCDTLFGDDLTPLKQKCLFFGGFPDDRGGNLETKVEDVGILK